MPRALPSANVLLIGGAPGDVRGMMQELTSSVVIDAPPEAIWPLFFTARMDDRTPFLFHFGLPKAVSCSIIKGDGAPGSIRRCITTRGYMDQVIECAEPMTRFGYRLMESDYWGQGHIGHVSDDIRLERITPTQTRVHRVTRFDAKGALRGPGLWVMRLGFIAAHRYANENWKRLAEAA